MSRIGVLISGRGSNLQALLDSAAEGTLGGTVAVVVSNVEGAPGLERARAAGVPAWTVPHKGLTREAHEQAVVQRLRDYDLQLVCLAGYMRLLVGPLLAAYAGRLLNVHPSLLPAFPGVDAQGQAIAHGVKVSGATVHFVEAALDRGPIVSQEAVTVREDDDVEALAARILEAEHRIYARAVRLVLEGRLSVTGRRVHLKES